MIKGFTWFGKACYLRLASHMRFKIASICCSACVAGGGMGDESLTFFKISGYAHIRSFKVKLFGGKLICAEPESPCHASSRHADLLPAIYFLSAYLSANEPNDFLPPPQ